MSAGILRRRAFSGLPLEGHNLVRLIHLDESGISELRQEPHVVVAGTIMEPDFHYKLITNDLVQLGHRYVPSDRYDHFKGFHATELFNGTGKVFTDWPIDDTLPIIEGVIRVLWRYRLPIIYGTCDRERYKAHERPHMMLNDKEAAHAMAFLVALLRANRWMRRNARPEEVAMVVVEDNDQMRARLKWMQTWLRYPADVLPELRGDLPLERIIESGLFAKKEDSSVLPLADMCAYVMKRKISGKRIDSLFDWIAPLIDRGTKVENDPVRVALDAIRSPVPGFIWTSPTSLPQGQRA